ncbi:MAG: DNA cytosine methyltransferase [Promicromonosporaceae bacterium]|nr:DNA cytosine methyltransferase [Promicromonosporaceae bacterium]
MRALNLYAGIGGNRALWPADVAVTAVEWDEATAAEYAAQWPDDELIVADAHAYLETHIFAGWDFIWSSPPCQTHSKLNAFQWGHGRAKYPATELWQEITLLKHALANSRTKWVVENVRPYYELPIPPTATLHRHNYWANFHIPQISRLRTTYISNSWGGKGGWSSPAISTGGQRKANLRAPAILEGTAKDRAKFNLADAIDAYGITPKTGSKSQQGQWLRNAVHPQIGRHILDAAMNRAAIDQNLLDWIPA